MRIESNIVRLTESHGNREVESDVSLLLTFRQLESKSGRSAEPEAVKDLRQLRYPNNVGTWCGRPATRGL